MALVAFLCALIALGTSQVGCGSTDGSFSIDDPLARPSGYCRLTHFPGFPDTLGSALLVALIYLTPVLVMAGGFVAAVVTRRRGIMSVSFGFALLLTLIVLALSAALAHVGYAGAG